MKQIRTQTNEAEAEPLGVAAAGASTSAWAGRSRWSDKSWSQWQWQEAQWDRHHWWGNDAPAASPEDKAVAQAGTAKLLHS